MYKYKIDVNLYTYWEPIDKNLGVSIVKEVTNNRQADEQGYVEVNDEERAKIQELYAERNNDPEPKEDTIPANSNIEIEELTKQVSKMKINEMKQRQVNKQLLMQVTELKMQSMKGAN